MRTIQSTFAYHPCDEEKPDLKVATDIIAKYEVSPVPHSQLINPKLEWDIKQNGILMPLKLYTNGIQATLGDGNHRIRIAKKLGIKKVPIIFIPDNFKRLSTSISGHPSLHPVLKAWVDKNLWVHAEHEVIRKFIGGGMRGGVEPNKFVRCHCSCGSTWKEEG